MHIRCNCPLKSLFIHYHPSRVWCTTGSKLSLLKAVSKCSDQYKNYYQLQCESDWFLFICQNYKLLFLIRMNKSTASNFHTFTQLFNTNSINTHLGKLSVMKTESIRSSILLMFLWHCGEMTFLADILISENNKCNISVNRHTMFNYYVCRRLHTDSVSFGSPCTVQICWNWVMVPMKDQSFAN